MALLSGDIVQVVQDNKSVSFMWSFPNFIPLSGPRVEGVINALKPFKFDRIHGAFTDRTVWSDGKGGPWNSFFFFKDPDGNNWSVQEKPADA